MITSSSKTVTTSSTTLYSGRPGAKYIAIQNHDALNTIVVTFGGEDAVLSPANGMELKAGDFGEIHGTAGSFNGPITAIAETGNTLVTLFVE